MRRHKFGAVSTVVDGHTFPSKAEARTEGVRVTDRARKATGNRYQPLVAALCRAEGWPEPLAEVMPVVGRRFRADLLWMSAALIVEIQGGVWLKRGGHTGGQAQIDDMEKLNELQLAGYRVLLVTPQQLQNGTLTTLLARAFQAVRIRDAIAALRGEARA